jgi:hypothetical protein
MITRRGLLKAFVVMSVSPMVGCSNPANEAREELSGITKDVNDLYAFLGKEIGFAGGMLKQFTPKYVTSDQVDSNKVTTRMIFISAKNPEREKLTQLGMDIGIVSVLCDNMKKLKGEDAGGMLQKGLDLQRRYNEMMQKAEKAGMIKEPERSMRAEPFLPS